MYLCRETMIGGTLFIWGLRTYVMGVINVTPDSFSGDGFTGDVEEITRKALIFQELGADIIDVGGESTRPPNVYDGAIPVDIEEELSRVIPAVTSMSRKLTIPISVDTYKALVMHWKVNCVRSNKGYPKVNFSERLI